MTDPTSRALSLLGLLQSRPSWAGPELAERLDVTTRTLRRDIDRLRDLGYTVDAEPGVGGGYRLGRGEVVPPLLLDAEQAVAVTLALTQAAQEGGPHAEAALRALATVDDMIPARQRLRLQALRHATVVTSPRGDGASRTSAEDLMACADAIRRTVRLSFTYTDRHGTTTSRTVEPHRLTASRYRWRLLAYDLDRRDWRTFHVDRLADPHPGTWRFTPRPDLDAALARLDEPAPPEAWRHPVVVHVHAPLDIVAASLPHAAGTLHALGDDVTELRTGADDPDHAAWWLARLGHDLTVLGDEAVVAAVGVLARRLATSVATTAPGARGRGGVHP